MKNRDIVSSLFCAVFGIVFCAGGLQHGLMRSGIPGRGCLPFIVGLILFFLSLALFLSAISKGHQVVKSSSSEKGTSRKMWFVILSLVAYAAALTHIGYLLTTFLFTVFMLSLVEEKGWRISLIFAFFTASLSWGLFVLLKVGLPTGILAI